MIYLFEDREERKRQFLCDEFNHSLIRHKPFDCTDAKEIIVYCRQNLANYKVPREVVFKDSLPKTAVGKILRRQLQDEK